MKRVLAVFSALVSFVAATALPAAPAHAASTNSLTIACRITPGFTFSDPCVANTIRPQYGIAFQVSGLSGAFTATWTVTGSQYQVSSGCTTTSTFCTINSQGGGGGDREYTGTAEITQGGQTTVLVTTATLPAVCGGMFC